MRRSFAAPAALAADASRESALLVAALVTAAFFVAFGALHYGFYAHGLLQDTPLYERYGDDVVHGGKVPYRDFAVEYPPAALPVFVAPSLGAGQGHFVRYRVLFEGLMLACGAVASALVGIVLALQRAGTARLAAGTLLAGLAPLALGPVILSRFDLWPATLTIAGLAAVVYDRRRLGFALLGVAVAAKLYPAVVLPPALVYVLRRNGRREAALCTAVAEGAALVWFLPFVALAPHGVWTSLSGQAQRPLQIESLGASLLLAAHQAWGLQLAVVSSHGSDNLTGHLPDLLANVQAALSPVALVGTWVAFARGEATSARLLRYCAAAICAFIVFSKVLSPQYLIWLIPLVPLVRGRRGTAAAALFVAAMVLTQLWFPRHYIELAYGFDVRASWLVVARDLTLLALLATLLWPARVRTKLGISVAGSLAFAAAAASVAAAAGLGTAGALQHSGILDETGSASTCARARSAPGTSPGTVRYVLAGRENASTHARCVTVTVHARGGQRLFSAAYLGAFDPAHPAERYLGDLGTCTNLAGATRASGHYAFRVPARARFVVEVEQCDPDGTTPQFALTLHERGP